jgi:hypothetical protein
MTRRCNRFLASLIEPRTGATVQSCNAGLKRSPGALFEFAVEFAVLAGMFVHQ